MKQNFSPKKFALEEFAFMEAAEESKLKGGISVDLETIIQRAETRVKGFEEPG